MRKQIIIEKNVLTTQMALLVEDELIQFQMDSVLEQNLQNKIVIGQVMQVVKNLNAVFVDYGEAKNGLLHLKQIPDLYKGKVQPGFRLPVQIIKQNIGEKGHKLTSKINLTGRYLVCLPFEPGISLSKKIESASKRRLLKTLLEDMKEPEIGFIVRTHAESAVPDDLIEDARQLIKQARKLLESSQCLSKGTVLYEEPSSIVQIIRSYLDKGDEVQIVCNDDSIMEEVTQGNTSYNPSEATTAAWRIDKHATNIFSEYSLQKKIDELLRRKVWLKNGGNLVIDYTEAMTIIDVNSAKAILTKNAEKATLELNKEAVKAAILQILRRNLSGMMMIDLVEMRKQCHKDEIVEYATALLLKYGESRTKVYPLTELGLLQISRTKKYQSIPHQLLEQCSCCHGQWSQTNFLYQMMQVEKQLKSVGKQEERQAVYLETSSFNCQKIKETNLVDMLEVAYPVRIELQKSPSNENNKISCHFYQR